MSALSGYFFMDSPGNDLESIAGQVGLPRERGRFGVLGGVGTVTFRFGAINEIENLSPMALDLNIQ